MDRTNIKLSDGAKQIVPGEYTHYKGGLFKVVCVAKHSEDPDQEFVVYQHLDDGSWWIRPLAMFTEHVEVGGYSGPRFWPVS